MRNLVRISLFFASLGVVFAAQSVQATGGTLSATLPSAAPWTTIGASTNSMRWEFRIHGFSPGNWPIQAILMPGGISPSQLYGVNNQGTNGNNIVD